MKTEINIPTFRAVVPLESQRADAGVASPLRLTLAAIGTRVVVARVLPGAARGGQRRVVAEHGDLVGLQVHRAVADGQVSQAARETAGQKPGT